MRKFTLVITALLLYAAAFAQTPVSQIHPAVRGSNFKWVKAPKPVPLSNQDPTNEKTTKSSPSVRDGETIIGHTLYDVQTNRAISSRLILNSDGTLSAAWTTSCVGSVTSPDRGTGYNYYDGTTWLSDTCGRIEPNSRTGYVNIGVTSSGKEFSIGHSSTVTGMLITSRPTKGSGDWTEDAAAMGSFDNDTWAKAVVGGNDGKTIHAIWNASGTSTSFSDCGQIGAVVYSRSTDEGATWPVLRECLGLIDSSSYVGFSADDYAIDAQGNNVAILVGDWTTDLVSLQSTDNGDTWTKTILYKFPIPFYDDQTMATDTDADGTADIVIVPSGDGKVKFDKNGMLHVVFSKVYVTEDFGGTGVSYYPDADGGLYYWDESMGSDAPFAIAFAQDLNGNDTLDYPAGPGDGSYFGSGTYGGGLTLQPTIGFDDANNMYVSYSTYDELADTTAFGSGFRHVYIIASFDGGQSWTNPLDVVPSVAEGGDGENQEAVYACMANSVDDKVRLTYQRDPAPGNSLSNLVAEQDWNVYTNDIVYYELSTSELVGVAPVKLTLFSVSQNTPNPFNDQTQFNITLHNQASVNLKVTDIVGQEVYSDNMNYSSGNHIYTFNKGNLAAGIYNFTVTVNGEKITKKIIIE